MKLTNYYQAINTHSVLKTGLAMMLIFTVLNASASQLWNNGDTSGVTHGWGQNSSSMDDFYVPGGGWFINQAETIGIFVDPATVSEVDVAIWAHDNAENEPNGDDVQVLNVTNIQATPTGRTFLDREEIKITVDFDQTFLKGQRYYWVEFTVRDQFGVQDFRFLARQGISHEPAWTHFGNGSISPSVDVYGTNLDLSFSISGSPVSVVYQGPDKFTTESDDNRGVFTGVKILKTRETENSAQIFRSPSENRQPAKKMGYISLCPAGTVLTPYEMPVYDDNGLFVEGYETVWFCIPIDLEPAG